MTLSYIDNRWCVSIHYNDALLRLVIKHDAVETEYRQELWIEGESWEVLDAEALADHCRVVQEHGDVYDESKIHLDHDGSLHRQFAEARKRFEAIQYVIEPAYTL